ncbi:MAG: hypothetical protein Q4P84_01970 [Elusimicrobiales bacterium]|nr:hypothetical protein [Elusimicrobiales bacterium]
MNGANKSIKISLKNDAGVLQEYDLFDVADHSFRRLLCIARIDNDVKDDYFQEIYLYLLRDREKLKGEYVNWVLIRAYRVAVHEMKMKTFVRSCKTKKFVTREDSKNYFERNGKTAKPSEEIVAKDLLETAMTKAKLNDEEKAILRWYVQDCKGYSAYVRLGSHEYHNLFKARENVKVVLSQWYKKTPVKVNKKYVFPWLRYLL